MKRQIKCFPLIGGIFVCFAACILMFFLLNKTDGALEYDDYDLIKENGKTYISLHINDTKEENSPNVEGSYSVALPPPPTFLSVAEMKKSIEKGGLTLATLKSVQERYAQEGVWEICDLDNLYDVRLPDGVSVKNITMRGTNYTFNLNCQIADYCGVTYCDESYYNKEFQEEYLDFPNELQEVTWEETTEDRNATVIYYQNETGQYRCEKYTIPQDERSLYVIERYGMIRYMDDGETSDTIPRTVWIFGEENGVYYTVYVHHPTERPSVEWLKSIELVPLDN